jgi:hypothetical protein
VGMSFFDHNPINFKESDRRGVAPVKRLCLDAPHLVHSLKTPLNRNPFLFGCFKYTEKDTREHLIIGFGDKFGSTTKIDGIAHVVGEPGHVTIPNLLEKEIRQRVQKEHSSEILLFHNHPTNLINVAFDNKPLASKTDRETLIRFYLNPLVGIKALLSGGRVRCYLGENGMVREFRGPELALLFQKHFDLFPALKKT